jgi:hypothetical protein
MRLGRIFGCVALALAVAGKAGAHHSFSALFDARRTITVTGEVTEFEFEAPHSYIHLDVSDEAGRKTAWQIETATPGMLIRKGMTPDTLSTGDVISVTGNPTRDGRNMIRLLTITMPDGTELRIQ